MAGQSPDGSWHSASLNGQAASGQAGHGGPDQARMPWQPPNAQSQARPRSQAYEQGQPYGQGQARAMGQPYEPQAPPPYEQAAYDAYPPPPSYGQPAGSGLGEGGDAQQEQHTMAWEQPAEQAAWDTGGQQRAPGGTPGRARALHAARSASHTAGLNKGFVAALFDFGFNSFVTPKVIKALYALATAWTLLVAIFLLLVGVRFGGANAGTVIFLLIGLAVFVMLSLGSIRVVLELFMALHRINENVQVLRDQGGQDGRAQ